MPRAGEGGAGETLLNRYRVLLWNDGNVLELERGGVAQHCGCSNYLCIAPFKTVNFLLREFHLNKLLKKKKKKNQATRCIWPMDNNMPIPVTRERRGWFNERVFIVKHVCCYNYLSYQGTEIKSFSRCTIFRAKNIECKEVSRWVLDKFQTS